METKDKKFVIEISTWTVFKLVFILLALWFLFVIKGILAILFIALILTALVAPFAGWLEKKKIPRGLAAIIVYLVLFGLLAGVAAVIIPPISEETKELGKDLPMQWEKLTAHFPWAANYSQSIRSHLKSLETNIPQTLNSAFSKITGVVGGIISFFVILVITYYMTVEEDALKRIFRAVAPSKYQPRALKVINKMQEKVSLWLRGQLILGLIVAVLTYVGLLILRVDYALVLALTAGILEVVPYLGPIIAAIPAIFLGFAQSPILALLVLILYFVIQQAENHILVPKIMQKAVGLNPVFCIIALLVGARVGGFVGVLLAIPVATAISVAIEEIYSETDNK